MLHGSVCARKEQWPGYFCKRPTLLPTFEKNLTKGLVACSLNDPLDQLQGTGETWYARCPADAAARVSAGAV